MEALAGWADEIVGAFREAGPDVTERSVFGGSAFFVGDALVGIVENVAGHLRVRFRDELRDDLASRAHFDPTVPLPTLLIVTEDDRDFARGLVGKAYEHAKRPAPPAARPAAPASAAPARTAAKDAAAAPRRRRPAR